MKKKNTKKPAEELNEKSEIAPDLAEVEEDGEKDKDPIEKEPGVISIDDAVDAEDDVDVVKPRFSDDGEDLADEYWENDDKNWGDDDEEDEAWGGTTAEEI